MKKMIRKTLLGLFCFLIIINPVFAYDIQSFDTEIEVYDDGIAKVINNLILDSTTINKAFLIPAYSPESIIVSDEEGEVKFAVIGNTLVIQPKKRISEYKLRIQYLTSSLTSKSEEKWRVSYLIPAYETIKVGKIERSRFVFSLPNTVTLITFSNEGVVFNEYNRMKIGWKLDLKDNESIEIEAVYKNSPKIAGMDYIKIAFYILVGILLAVLIVFCIKKGYCKIMKRITKGKKDIMKTLDKKENEVITLLLEKKNQLYQSIIQKDTGINKATLSRVIKRLENKEVIEVRPSGNTNLIVLQDWFIKK